MIHISLMKCHQALLISLVNHIYQWIWLRYRGPGHVSANGSDWVFLAIMFLNIVDEAHYCIWMMARGCVEVVVVWAPEDKSQEEKSSAYPPLLLLHNVHTQWVLPTPAPAQCAAHLLLQNVQCMSTCAQSFGFRRPSPADWQLSFFIASFQ